MMKILLINLPRQFETKDFTTPDYFLDDFVKYPPLGLLAIATGIDSQKHSLKIFDTAAHNLTLDEMLDFILKEKPNLLGISVVTRRLYAMRWLAQKIKKLAPQIKIVVGGPHINYFPMETMNLGCVDYVLPGYAENTFPQLVETIANGEKLADLKVISNLIFKFGGEIYQNLAIDKPIILDELSIINRRLINLDDYFTAADDEKMTIMYSSRGCPNRCIYCDVQEKQWSYYSAKRVVDEFEAITKLGIKSIHIFDDTFNINRQRVIDICKEILNRNLKIKWSARGRVYPFDEEMAVLLKKSGFKRWYIGVESLDQNILNYMKKGINLAQIGEFFRICHKYGIETMTYFIIGFPNETDEYRKKLYDKVVELKPTYVFFNILCPLPKTEYYASLLRDGTLKDDFWAEFVKNPTPDFVIPYPRSEALQKELIQLSDNYGRRFYFNPFFILKEFWRSLFYPKVLFFKIKAGFLMLYKIFLRKFDINVVK